MEWLKGKHIVWKFIVKNQFHIHIPILALMCVSHFLNRYSPHWQNGIEVAIESFLINLFVYGFLCVSPASFIMRSVLTDAFHIKDINEDGEVTTKFENMLDNFIDIEYKLYNKILLAISIPITILYLIVIWQVY